MVAWPHTALEWTGHTTSFAHGRESKACGLPFGLDCAIGQQHKRSSRCSVRLFNKDGREIPFHSMERSRALILPPRYFAESDGGAEALEDVMRELHENPNTLTADLYLLRESFHIPAKFLTPELKAALVEAGAIPHPTLRGIVLMAQGVPQVIKEAEDQGWIKRT
jgi:hypothetical protein